MELGAHSNAFRRGRPGKEGEGGGGPDGGGGGPDGGGGGGGC